MRLVKDIITGPQCLARYDPRKPIVLITDASRIGLGFVLVHPEVDDLLLNKDGYLITTSPTSYTIKKHPKGRLITCGSRFISATELNYAIVELEMLALVWAVQKCRLYLAGTKFELVDTLSISPSHEMVLLTKFQDYCMKFADFLLLANFLASLIFYASVYISEDHSLKL